MAKRLNIQLVAIDPQNDFCDIPGAALPVTGANADMERLAKFVGRAGHKLSDIHVTLDIGGEASSHCVLKTVQQISAVEQPFAARDLVLDLAFARHRGGPRPHARFSPGKSARLSVHLTLY
jgi:nicotinamidase-related amidase